MKAWMIPPHEVDHQVFICHAETRGKAKSILANEIGAGFTEVSVVRVPVADDLPLTNHNLLLVGVYGSVECSNLEHCSKAVYHDQGDSWLHSIDENGDPTMAFVTRDGRVYCSEDCWRQHTS